MSTCSAGVISTDTTFTASPGLNVIDIDTGGADFILSNANLVVDGPVDAIVIFRLPGNINMIVTQGNILIGTSGIGLRNVLFVTCQTTSGTHFDVSNAVINGVAFWSLGPNNGMISVDNSQGCTQLVADNITLNNSRFTRCAFTCVPDCAGRNCGDDGCGGSCGTCDNKCETCGPAGTCDPVAACCKNDADCPSEKCRPGFCDFGSNTCQLQATAGLLHR